PCTPGRDRWRRGRPRRAWLGAYPPTPSQVSPQDPGTPISYHPNPMIGLTTTSRLLKALADETRLRVLNLLAQEELSGTDLMEILNLGQSRVSTHLALLKEVGLVNDRPQARRTLSSLAPGPAGAFVQGVLAENRAAPEFEADLAGL